MFTKQETRVYTKQGSRLKKSPLLFIQMIIGHCTTSIFQNEFTKLPISFIVYQIKIRFDLPHFDCKLNDTSISFIVYQIKMRFDLAHFDCKMND